MTAETLRSFGDFCGGRKCRTRLAAFQTGLISLKNKSWRWNHCYWVTVIYMVNEVKQYSQYQISHSANILFIVAVIVRGEKKIFTLSHNKVVLKIDSDCAEHSLNFCNSGECNWEMHSCVSGSPDSPGERWYPQWPPSCWKVELCMLKTARTSAEQLDFQVD